MAETLEKLAAFYGLSVVEFDAAFAEFERQVSPRIASRDLPIARSWFYAGWKARAEKAEAVRDEK